ncbi:hypothetical protein C8N25_1351, partial [Algoriphagus antarcticus]
MVESKESTLLSWHIYSDSYRIQCCFKPRLQLLDHKYLFFSSFYFFGFQFVYYGFSFG